MKNFLKYFGLFIVLTCTVYTFLYFYYVPILIDKKNNFIEPTTTQQQIIAIPEWHKDLMVADLHADTLLWNRDLLTQASRGHVDIPRMIQGNMGLQGFSIVTQSPPSISYGTSSGGGNNKGKDNILWLSIFQGWPMKSWFHLSDRAFHQIDRLSDAVRSSSHFFLIRNKSDLENYISRKTKDKNITAGWIALEGAQSLGEDLRLLETYFQAGVRMMSPAHLTDNQIGGSQQGTERYGLTELGKNWIRKMNELGMIVDLAHASEKTIDDILELSTTPPVVSHTGIKGTCENNRNLSDEYIKKIAAKGGLIGIGFWDGATCGKSVDDIVKAIVYTKNLVGIEHVALGSDWDGYVSTPFDVSKIGVLTGALVGAGLTQDEISSVMGANVFEFLLKHLPAN